MLQQSMISTSEDKMYLLAKRRRGEINLLFALDPSCGEEMGRADGLRPKNKCRNELLCLSYRGFSNNDALSEREHLRTTANTNARMYRKSQNGERTYYLKRERQPDTPCVFLLPCRCVPFTESALSGRSGVRTMKVVEDVA